MMSQRKVAVRSQACAVLAIKALVGPQVLPRICGLMAQFDMIPQQLCAQRTVSHLLVEVELLIDDARRLDILVEKIRAIVTVERATLIKG